MKQIVCISTSNYYPFPTRKQNVMNRLQDAEILYIDPPVSLLAPLKDKTAFGRLMTYRKPGRKVKENITVYSAPPVIPFFNKYRSINKTNQRRLAKYLKKQMKEHGFEKPYLWCYSPTSCDLINEIPNRGVIYDCVDRHSAYKGMIDPAVVDQMEKDLATQASQVFCTAYGLYETLVNYNTNTELIPNGAAYEIFSKAATLEERNDRTKKPVFGFVGMFQECIDYECIEALAKAYPEGEIILIGKALPGVDLSLLEKYPNIRFPGLIPQAELPDYIRKFDVCLNVFRKGRLSKDVSPLKFYEYLATGKPIVSTEEPLQVLDFANVIYIAENVDDFVVKCGEAQKESDSEKVKMRMAYGKACSWDERVKQMEKTLKQKGIF
ncbi:MAG: glycosyltransferase [Eubacteriales bacterium]|nr:glycosyltransferase [Eubacteriales bacterium]MDD4584228.1 glycosyltransferase [Eubacteriales bacterium]